MNETRVKLAARMYECRDTLKLRLGDEYAEQIAPVVSDLKALAEKFGCSVMQVLPRLCEKDAPDGMEILWLTAATVEAIEPSEGPCKTATS